MLGFLAPVLSIGATLFKRKATMQTLDVASGLIDKLIPDKNERARATERMQELVAKGDLDRVVTVIHDSQSKDRFRSYWRPFMGWSCALALFYSLVIVPVVEFMFTLHYWFFHSHTVVDTPVFPVPPTEMLMSMAALLLGAAGLRTVEKVKQVHKERL